MRRDVELIVLSFQEFTTCHGLSTYIPRTVPQHFRAVELILAVEHPRKPAETISLGKQKGTVIMSTSVGSIQTMFQHLPVLRRYARRALLQDEVFDAFEEQDRKTRMQEYLQTGCSMNWTARELTALLFRDVFPRG